MDDWSKLLTQADIRVAAQTSQDGGERALWGRTALEALDRIALDKHAASGLVAFIEDVARSLRRSVSPFADYLEVPKAVADLYQEHSARLDEVDHARLTALSALLDDTAAALCGALGPISWNDLRQLGVETVSPPADPHNPGWD